MITELKEKVLEVLNDAREHPKKYCSIFWTTNRKEIAINNSSLPIKTATLVYLEEERTITVNTAVTDIRFVLFCRPKKHIALILDENGKTHYKLFRLNQDTVDQPNNTHLESIACVLETTTKDTFLLAFVRGLYLTQTFDSEYTVTLYEVISELLRIKESSGKEENPDE